MRQADLFLRHRNLADDLISFVTFTSRSESCASSIFILRTSIIRRDYDETSRDDTLSNITIFFLRYNGDIVLAERYGTALARRFVSHGYVKYYVSKSEAHN